MYLDILFQDIPKHFFKFKEHYMLDTVLGTQDTMIQCGFLEGIYSFRRQMRELGVLQ